MMTGKDRVILTAAAMLIVAITAELERLSNTKTDLPTDATKLSEEILRIAGEDEEATE